MKFNSSAKSALLASASLIAASPALAQTPTTTSSDDGQLNAVVVTAQRRSQNVQDIPVAVSAFSAQTLDRQQITNTIDLTRSIPNMVSANNVLLGTSVTYFIRGTGSTESIATFDLPVGTYVDDVYLARQNANQLSLSDADRVEVLRGPQGTLFGRNTTGGAVSIVTKKPNDTYSLAGEASYGSFNRRAFDGEVNAPITDKIMTRFSAFYVKDDGYLKNPPTGNPLNGEDSWGARAAVRLLLTDHLMWDGSAQYIDDEDTHVGVPGVVKPGPAGPFTVYPVASTGDLLTGRYSAKTCRPTGPVDTWASQNCLYDDSKSTLLISNFTLDTSLGKLNLISGYYQIQQDFVADNFANTDQPILGGGFGSNYYLANKGKDTQFSHELKLSGSALHKTLEYVYGLYYLHEADDTDFVDTVDLAGVGPVIFGDRILNNGTSSYAAYGQVDYHLTNKLTVQLGGRYTDEKKSFGLHGLLFGAPVSDTQIAAAGVPLEQTVKRFTPRAAAFYKFNRDVLFYASYTEGFKSGGWNARAFTAQELVPFAPEYVKSYEVGEKSEFLDHRARLNATLFRAEYSNLQVPAIFQGTTDFVTVNAANALVQGLELEGSWNVIDKWNVFTNIGLMDGEYTHLTAAAIAAALGPKMQRTPKSTIQVGTSYGLELSGGNKLQFSADGQYTDQFETGPANTLAGHVGPHALLNSQLTWTPPNSHWAVSVECKNCTNEVYVVQELLGQLFANEPRRVDVRVKFNY